VEQANELQKKFKKIIKSLYRRHTGQRYINTNQKHLESCPDCRKEYLELKNVISSLNILFTQSRPAPETLTQSIMTKITQEK